MFGKLARRLRTAISTWLSVKKLAWKAVWQEHLEGDREWLLATFGFDPFDKEDPFGEGN